MNSVADTLTTIAGNRYQALTPDERLSVEAILDAAAGYLAGTMTLATFANVGAMKPSEQARPSTSFGRFVALMSTPTTDERRADLRRAVDKTIRLSGLVITTAGVWDREDLVGMVIHPAKEAEYLERIGSLREGFT